MCSIVRLSSSEPTGRRERDHLSRSTSASVMRDGPMCERFESITTIAVSSFVRDAMGRR